MRDNRVRVGTLPRVAAAVALAGGLVAIPGIPNAVLATAVAAVYMVLLWLLRAMPNELVVEVKRAFGRAF